MRRRFSDKEFDMIQGVSPKWAKVIAESIVDSLGEVQILETIAVEAFTQDKRSPAVDALRRGLGALHKCKVYRNTPEYEKLITLDSV